MQCRWAGQARPLLVLFRQMNHHQAPHNPTQCFLSGWWEKLRAVARSLGPLTMCPTLGDLERRCSYMTAFTEQPPRKHGPVRSTGSRQSKGATLHIQMGVYPNSRLLTSERDTASYGYMDPRMSRNQESLTLLIWGNSCLQMNSFFTNSCFPLNFPSADESKTVHAKPSPQPECTKGASRCNRCTAMDARGTGNWAER